MMAMAMILNGYDDDDDKRKASKLEQERKNPKVD